MQDNRDDQDGHVPPNWPHWVQAETVTIREAVALSLSIHPYTVHVQHGQVRIKTAADLDSRIATIHFAPVEFSDKFLTRLDLAMRAIGGSLPAINLVAHQSHGVEPRVYLTAFVSWALERGWPLPDEIRQLARGAQHIGRVDAPDPGHREFPTGSEQPAEPDRISTSNAEFEDLSSLPLSEAGPTEPTKRELRRQKTKRKYDTWRSLVAKYRHKEGGGTRTPSAIARKIAADPDAQDPVSGKAPNWASVLRRLNDRYGGWAGSQAEKSQAEIAGK